jgi:hypothetical protein
MYIDQFLFLLSSLHKEICVIFVILVDVCRSLPTGQMSGNIFFFCPCQYLDFFFCGRKHKSTRPDMRGEKESEVRMVYDKKPCLNYYHQIDLGYIITTPPYIYAIAIWITEYYRTPIVYCVIFDNIETHLKHVQSRVNVQKRLERRSPRRSIAGWSSLYLYICISIIIVEQMLA